LIRQRIMPRSGQLSTISMGLAVVIFTLALVVFPKQGFETGMSGLSVFWDIVFPSLLPFFILSELLLGLGIVRGLGVFLEPLMRPLFSVPGVGGFALSMGLAAGYPMDAIITARFRESGLCSRIEGERMLAFTNTADPLFMFGAVAVGMFKSAELGVLLALAHYISSFLVGVTFKFWGRRAERVPSGPDVPTPASMKSKGSLFVRAYQETMEARAEDARPFGKLLKDAVTESIQTLLMICGFIVFFAVFIEILRLSGIMKWLGIPLVFIYHLFGINHGLVNPTLAGIFELDIGTAQTAAVNAPLIQKIALASGIIAWSGLAVHAQVASVLTQTDIRMRPYFIARFLHAVLAAGITVVLYHYGIGVQLAHAFAFTAPIVATFHEAATGAPWWHVMTTGLANWAYLVVSLIIVSLAIYTVRRVRGSTLKERAKAE